jgi:hypothetical protein
MNMAECPLVKELEVNMALIDNCEKKGEKKYFFYQQEGDIVNNPVASAQLLLNRCGVCLKCIDPKITLHCLRQGPAWENNGDYLGIETSGMIDCKEI